MLAHSPRRCWPRLAACKAGARCVPPVPPQHPPHLHPPPPPPPGRRPPHLHPRPTPGARPTSTPARCRYSGTWYAGCSALSAVLMPTTATRFAVIAIWGLVGMGGVGWRRMWDVCGEGGGLAAALRRCDAGASRARGPRHRHLLHPTPPHSPQHPRTFRISAASVTIRPGAPPPAAAPLMAAAAAPPAAPRCASLGPNTPRCPGANAHLIPSSAGQRCSSIRRLTPRSGIGTADLPLEAYTEHLS